MQVKALPERRVRILLMAGALVNEPIITNGPFVMNTAVEIQQAITELPKGTLYEASFTFGDARCG